MSPGTTDGAGERLSVVVAQGLADAGMASLATFTVGLVAARFLGPNLLALYALFFTGFILSATVPAQLIFTPIENSLVGHKTEDQRAELRRSLLLGFGLSTVGACLTLLVVWLVSESAGVSFHRGMALTAVATMVLSPLQDHLRRMMHQLGNSRAAASLSSLQFFCVVATAIALLATDIHDAWIPFGALMVANAVTLCTGLIVLRPPARTGPSHLAITDMVRVGGWLVAAAFTNPAAAFVVYALVAFLAEPAEVGFAEGARLLASPMSVTTIGLAAVLRPRVVEASKRGDDGSVVRLHRTGAWLALGLTAASIVVFGVRWPGSPLPSELPIAYEVTGLAAGMILAAGIALAIASVQLELQATGRERRLAAVNLAGAVTSLLITLALARSVGAYAVMYGAIGAGIVMSIGSIRARRLPMR